MKDKKVRTAITKESFSYFFNFYYAHYVKYPTADFQKEIMHLLEKDDNENLFVVAFRGSGKSTIITTAYPIWAILGKQQKKFVTIFCQTQAQAKQHMMNLRRELEYNDLLKKDLGPFKEYSDEWGSSSLVFSNTNARITVASTEQSIRGIRHNEHRPDLIICDDIEDMISTKTREGRNKTYRWLRGEVVPAGDKYTRLIIVGNLLHEDSLLMRLREDVENNRADGKFLFFPLIDDDGACLWSGKYSSKEDIDTEKRKIGNDIAWQREYLLNIVPDVEQVIHKEWISYYDELPNKKHLVSVRIGVDPAISQKETADYTSMVSCLVYDRLDEDNNAYIYVLPHPINKRLTFPETFDKCIELNSFMNKEWTRPIFSIESVAYQMALPQQLEQKGVETAKIKPTKDKRSRLALISHIIKEGRVLFPQKGCEELINQLVNFGVEKHDDLADACAYAILSVVDDPPQRFEVVWLC
jgi:predicted phage terminase large subunit-like protein